MNYFRYKGHYLFAHENAVRHPATKSVLPGIQPVSFEEALSQADLLHFLFSHDPAKSKHAFAITDTSLLKGTPEGLHNLRESQEFTESTETEKLYSFLETRNIRAVNICAPGFWENFGAEQMIYNNGHKAKPGKKRVHILALGDVGGILLLGLKLMGGHVISSIGIYDLSPAAMQRMEYEMNQMHYPDRPDIMPEVEIITENELFDCDIFVFCASKGVPPLDAKVGDVRMIQYEGNKKIISRYAGMADEKKFRGIFAVVSDPVDMLCRAALFDDTQAESAGKSAEEFTVESAEEFTVESAGELAVKHAPRQNLRPEQIKGYGLGVMNSRGIYYARKDKRFETFLTKGRCYGPHGNGLVLANDITCYDPALSDELTHLALHANLRTRETGFKPYLAPAIASGAISIILTLEGAWHYSSNFLGGVYMGARNRILPGGLEIERIAMSDELYTKLLRSYNDLKQSEI